jgi:4-hydroxybenzoate polyprenyltransferase
MRASFFRATLPGLFRLMRPRQWIKNSFVLAPLVFTGEFVHLAAVGHSLFAALLFCLASSAIYIINDLHDIEADRRHPQKAKSRPLAAGIVTPRAALGLLACLCVATGLGALVAPKVVGVAGLYFALNLAYTFVLKHQPVLDIFTVAIGFVLRVFAGAVALDVPLSGWTFVTTLCLALYLAAVKRRQELLGQSGAEGRKVLEKYPVALIERYAEMSASGALFFYSMFVMAEENPPLIATVPLVLFGLFRYWYVVETLEGGESPTDSLLSDKQLLVTIALWVGVCAWAFWPTGA